MEKTSAAALSPAARQEAGRWASQGTGGGATGRSWMVWLQPPLAEAPSMARAGLDRGREWITLGRCFILLPNDGEPYSWHRDGTRAALLYGRLHNGPELRRRLELPEAPDADEAALLLAAYAAWGEHADREFEGAFAAVIWDEANDTLLCFRDAIGVMPVFYAPVGAGLVLSSDVWTVLGHPDVPRAVDRSVVAAHLLCAFSTVRVEETFFEHVRRLPGAHRLRVTGRALTTARYWDPLPPGQPIRWMDREEVRQFPEIMRQTIAGCMAGEPAAVSLSSGIDSVSVATLAAEVAQQNGWPTPHGLSLHFADPSCDESAGQTAVARALGMPFRLFSFEECLGGRPLLEATMELTRSYPSPLINMWEPLYRHMTATAAEQGLRVILTGTGGDEWLGVTPLWAADLLRAGNLIGLWQLYRTQMRSYRVKPIPFGKNLLWSFGLRELLRDAHCRYFPERAARRRQRRGPQLPDWIAPEPELRRQLQQRLQPSAPQPPIDSVYIRDLRPALQHALVMMELEEFHYRARGLGTRYLHPYWSRPMVSYLLRVPPPLLNQGGYAKGLVRSVLAERLPALDLHRQQKKFTVVDFYRNLVFQARPTLWGRWAHRSALAAAGVVDVGRLEAAMEAATASGRAGQVALWLCTESWLRGQQ